MTQPKKLTQTLTEFTTAVGQDVKALQQKDAQIEQELNTLKEQSANGINEARITELLTAQKTQIDQAIATAKTEVKNELLNGAGAEYDTLKEIGDYIKSDKGAGTALAMAVANRVRFDEAQVLTPEQQKQASANIGLGDITTDFLAIYNRAKA